MSYPFFKTLCQLLYFLFLQLLESNFENSTFLKLSHGTSNVKTTNPKSATASDDVNLVTLSNSFAALKDDDNVLKKVDTNPTCQKEDL